MAIIIVTWLLVWFIPEFEIANFDGSTDCFLDRLYVDESFC